MAMVVGGPAAAQSLAECVVGSRHDVTETDLGQAQLAERDLSCQDLSGFYLVQANLRDANLSKALLRGTLLGQADLTAANLRGAVLDGANLIQAEMVRADLRGATFTGANLTQADLREANATGARFDGARMVQADLRGADLSDASLQGASLIQARTEGAVLTGVLLEGAVGLDGGRPVSTFPRPRLDIRITLARLLWVSALVVGSVLPPILVWRVNTASARDGAAIGSSWPGAMAGTEVVALPATASGCLAGFGALCVAAGVTLLAAGQLLVAAGARTGFGGAGAAVVLSGWFLVWLASRPSRG